MQPRSTFYNATPKQVNYLLILFNDLGFTENSRRVWLTDRFKRSIKHEDELELGEAVDAITYLKGLRERQR